MLSFLIFLNVEFFVVFLVLFRLMNNLYLDEEYCSWIKMSELTFWIVELVYILYLIMLAVNIGYKFRLNLVLIVLAWIIRVRSFLVFFLFYEIIFILIIFRIVLLGYRYERLVAVYLIMFYSFVFSRPIIIILLLFDSVFIIKRWLYYGVLICYFVVWSFIVKFPIFGVHYWLPVAHVEASTLGSILLAGVLLKLGSVGLIYVVMYLNFIIKFHWMGVGVIIIILLILRLRDLKMIIAYSSIAHMRVVFYVLIMGWNVGKKGAIFIMFYHGFISPLIFWVVGLLVWWKRRSLIIVKVISFSNLFILSLFLLLILNIGFPPLIGFISEVLMLKSIFMNKLILVVFVTGVLFRCYYNIYLFWCFIGVSGNVMKVNFFRYDIMIFMLFSFFLNFF